MIDKNRAITVEDLIRRYDLEGLKSDRKAIKTLDSQLTKVNVIIEKYIKSMKRYAEDQDNITSWFYSGIPTLQNEPFINFTDEEKASHINDLYYDKDTGLIYQLKYENGVYNWVQIDDSALREDLAVTNSAADSADNCRRVFFSQPIPPYSIGDIWYEDNVIKRCRCNRSEGEYNPMDWCLLSEYSDEMILSDTTAVLNQFITTVEENYTTNATLELTKNSILGVVEAETTRIETTQNANYDELSSRITATNQQMSIISQDVDSINLQVSEIQTKQVEDFNALNSELTATKESVASISMEIDEINLSVSQKLDDKEFTGANIMLKINEDESEAVIEADKIKLEGYTTINDGFSIDLEGNATMNNATINGGLIKMTDDSEDGNTPKITIDGKSTNITNNGKAELGAQSLTFTAKDSSGKDTDYNVSVATKGIRPGIYTNSPSTIGTFYSAQHIYDTNITMLNMRTTDWSRYIEMYVIDGTSTPIMLSLADENTGKTTTITNEAVSSYAFNNLSLEDKKKNIVLFTDALEVLKQADIYSYNWKSDTDNAPKHYGLIIGEGYNTPEEFLSSDKTGIDTYCTLSICLQAIKELSEKVEILENKIKILEGE